MKSFFRQIKNQGFSLIEIMMAVGLVGVASVAFMTLTDNTSKDANWADMNLVKAEFVSSFERFLNSSRACKDLKNDENDYSTTVDLKFEGWKVAGVEGNPSLGMTAGRQFKYFTVTEISSKPVTFGATEQNIVYVKGNPGIKTYLEIVMRLKTKANLKKSDLNASDRIYTYTFKVPVIINSSTNKVMDCFENQTFKNSCQAMLGSSDDGICTKKGNCIVDNSFVIYDDTEIPSKTPFMPWMSSFQKFPMSTNPDLKCKPGFKAYSTGGESSPPYTLPSGCKGCPDGKDTAVAVIYTCMKCTPASSGGSPSGTYGGFLIGGSAGGGNVWYGTDSGSGSGSGP